MFQKLFIVLILVIAVSSAKTINRIISNDPPPDSQWRAAYSIVIEWNEWECIEGLYRIKGGITQNLYDMYNKRYDVPAYSVCEMNRHEHAEIYNSVWQVFTKSYVWPASIAAFDMADVHGGQSNFYQDVLEKCQRKVECINAERIAAYEKQKYCTIFCTQLLARVRAVEETIRKTE